MTVTSDSIKKMRKSKDASLHSLFALLGNFELYSYLIIYGIVSSGTSNKLKQS